MSKPLRAVKPGESPPKPLSIAGAAKAGDRRDYLVAMRARVSSTLDDPKTSPRDLASLMRRASELDKEIRSIDEAAEAEAEDDEVGDEEWDATAI